MLWCKLGWGGGGGWGGIEVDKVETGAFNFLVVFFIHFGIKGSKGTQ